MNEKRKTPEALGYRMPAEWEHHEATWIGWPHNAADWPGKMSPIRWVFGEMVRKIAEGEKVRLLVNSPRHEASAKTVLAGNGANMRNVEFFRFPTDRGWTRDFGPIFVKKSPPKPDTAIVKFRFNGWAKYPNWKKDNQAAARVAEKLGIKMFPITSGGKDFVLEGGAIDVNGRGTLITTEECLLDAEVQVRNPGLPKEEVEKTLRASLGATNVFWLGKGIAGDDTHGHVDDLCRFVSPDTIALCSEKNPKDSNYAPLAENRERMEDMRLENGSKPEIVELPMPEPLIFRKSRLPASYANFYMSNAAVLVPTFNDRNDRLALGILSELFKDRPVVGIHAVDLVWGLGTIHCLTQQQPSA